MKIETPETFWIAAECWYQRTHRLREVTERYTESPQRKNKALRLFLVMAERMQKCGQVAFKMQQPKIPTWMKSVGISTAN